LIEPGSLSRTQKQVTVRLRAEHAVELGELLEFLGNWFDHAPGVLADALVNFCGAGYTVEDLRADVARFSFLVGGDGERFVFGDDR
jgi:hypothetical protein